MTTDGLLLVDKQRSITSHDVVDLFRRATKIKKAGHTGTLDPLATGLLVLCVGKATRLQSYLMRTEKTYEGTIRFGWATTTYDAEGEPVGEPIEADVTSIDFEKFLPQLRGDIEQVPPAYSAKKIAGKRAYALAREGQAPVLEAKRVHVEEFSLFDVAGSTARFRVRCSAGTYVRSLAYDLGQLVGVPAHLAELRRTAIGSYSVSEAFPSAEFANATREQIIAGPHFKQLGAAELPMQTILIDPAQEKQILHGSSIIAKPLHGSVGESETVALANLKNELVAIAQVIRVIRADGPVELQPKVVLAD